MVAQGGGPGTVVSMNNEIGGTATITTAATATETAATTIILLRPHRRGCCRHQWSWDESQGQGQGQTPSQPMSAWVLDGGQRYTKRILLVVLRLSHHHRHHTHCHHIGRRCSNLHIMSCHHHLLLLLLWQIIVMGTSAEVESSRWNRS